MDTIERAVLTVRVGDVAHRWWLTSEQLREVRINEIFTRPEMANGLRSALGEPEVLPLSALDED